MTRTDHHPRSWLTRALALVLLVPLLASCGSGSGSGGGDGDGPTKIRMVYTSNIVSYLPFHVAQQAGIFEKHGIDFSGVQVDTDADAIRALVGGEAEMVSGVPEPFVNAIATGVDMKIISSNLNHNIYNLLGGKDVTSLEDIVGQKVAVYTLSNSTYFWTRWILDQNGLDSEDVEYVVVGSQAARLSALQEGQVAATIIAIPQAITAEEQGFPVIERFADVPEAADYPMTVSVTSGSMIENDRDALVRYNQALEEAIEFIHENTDEAIQMGVKGMGTDEETLRASLDQVLEHMDGNLEPSALPFVIDTATTYGDIPGDPPTVEDIYLKP